MGCLRIGEAYGFLIGCNEQPEHDALNDMTPIQYRNQSARRPTFEISA